MLETLQNPIVIAVLLLVVLLLAVFIIMRRRRQPSTDLGPPPELGGGVDYTALPVEEPQTFADRMRARSPLVWVVGLLILLAVLGFGTYSLLAPNGTDPSLTSVPPPPAPAITNVTAQLVGPNRVLVEADTTLPDGADIQATMRENDQDFPWFRPESASGKASSGKVQLALIRAPAGPNPKQASTYTIELRGTSLGRSVSSGPAELAVPQALSGAFFASPVPAAAAATAAPTSTPTAAPQPTAATPTETVAASATAVSFSVPTTLTAQVSNSGNLREQPNLTGKVLGQIKSGETVTLLEKTADGGWFRLTAAAGTGWSSATLLAVPRETAAAVPGPGQTAAQPTASAAQPTAAAPAPFNGPPVSGQTAKVTQGGNVRTTASRDGAVLGLVDTNDTVQLRGRSANNAWMLGTTGKGLTGWINAALLQLPANVAQLPVTALTVTAQSAALPPTPNAVQPTAAPQATPKPTASAPQPTAAPQATPKPTAGTPQPTAAAAPSGLTAKVFNGGRIRSAPQVQDSPSNQVGTVNAKETVTLLAKTADGKWYKITDMRNVTGWVSATLLSIDPAVAAKVPVGT